MMAQAYYLPFFFQAVQATSAKVSGVQILPSGITIAIATLVSGIFITMVGYYVPFMWTGAAIFTVGCYLLHTLVWSSTMKAWFGYQVIIGIGYGISVQVPYLAVQVVVISVDRPLANALISLFQALGGALGLSIAENVFQTWLIKRLDKIQDINVPIIIASGGTDLETIVSASNLDSVRNAFSGAVINAFLVSVAAAGAAFVTSLGIEWRRIGVKKDSPEMRDNSVVESTSH
ncbi:uncharacterized protein BHQ10_007653 [Talaromyces amestolkiae]|uniref:Major facilitator superfamily (MFS) profile domain-containing protein n=1 Tax=Talaromyces amestolkiae TaxID=1196081 RepID=A0A364L7H3_TALAM|nr:uncharacterized protein BHQ10_007653 [Talaromyces amestolkiae]RAO71641.1 hypothetical protein BHQ10_007653 [Talaromyces amestolkiae]